MTNNHTPAPWHIESEEKAFIIKNTLEDRPDYIIGCVQNVNKYKQNEANARLIAAAPELLEALYGLLNLLANNASVIECTPLVRYMLLNEATKGEKAVEKATGKECDYKEVV